MRSEEELGKQELERQNQERQSQERETLERTVMSNIPVYKTWNVPSYADNGPVTIALRLPRVSVIDAAGNEIVIPPEQAALLGSKLADITDWLHYGDSDWSAP